MKCKTYDAEPQMIYWTIHELAKLMDEPQSTIVYWIKTFDIPSFLASKKRKLTTMNVERLIEIRKLLRIDGYTIVGAKKKLGLISLQK